MQSPQTTAACQHHGVIATLADAKTQTGGRIAHAQQQQPRRAQRVVHAFEQRTMRTGLYIVQHIQHNHRVRGTEGGYADIALDDVG